MIADESALTGAVVAPFDLGPLERVADTLPNGVLFASPDGTIMLVNGLLADQFGYSRDELIGQPVEVLLPEPLRDVHREHRRGFQAGPKACPVGVGRELFGRRRDGTPSSRSKSASRHCQRRTARSSSRSSSTSQPGAGSKRRRAWRSRAGWSSSSS